MVTINGVQYFRADCGTLVPFHSADDHTGCVRCILANCQG